MTPEELGLAIRRGVTEATLSSMRAGEPAGQPLTATQLYDVLMSIADELLKVNREQRT